MGTVEKNRFSELLEELLNTAEIRMQILPSLCSMTSAISANGSADVCCRRRRRKRKSFTGISHEIVKQGSKKRVVRY